MGMPRQAAVGMMKDGKGQIAVKFVLEGKLDDPRFSLNENLATRFGASMADTLGVSLEGIAKGAGGIGQKGLEAGGGPRREWVRRSGACSPSDSTRIFPYS